MRAPASGAKIKRASYPDIVAIYKGKVIVLEVKRRSELSTIYIDEEQVNKLRTFCERAGGKGYIAVKIPYKEWVFISIDKLVKINNKYRLDKNEIINGMKLGEVLSELGIKRGLETYLKSDK